MSIASGVTASDETTSDARPRQKRPPPPPLPPPPEKCRRNKSRPAETCQPQCDTASCCPTAESVASEYHHRDSRTDTVAGVIEAKSPRSRDTISTRRENPTADANDDDPIPGSIATSRAPFPPIDVAFKRKSPDKYPPLFFTMRDFQDVMSATRTGEPAATSAADADDKPPNSRERESSSSTTLDVGSDDDVCFRVTTTNLPFERCLERRRSPFDDEFALGEYRFEDDIDGNTRANDRAAAPGCDVFDINADSGRRVGTRVRFVIDSPSFSTPKMLSTGVKIAVQSEISPSCETTLREEQTDERGAASTLKLAEIRDERADVRDRGNNSPGKARAPSTDKSNIAAGEDDPFPSSSAAAAAAANKVDAILRTRCDDEDNDVNREEIRKGARNSPSWNERVGNEKPGIGEEKIRAPITGETSITSGGNAEKQADQSRQMLDASSEITTKNTYRLTGKSSATARGTEEANAAKITSGRTGRREVFLKKTSDDIKEKRNAKNEKIFISESPRDVSSRLDDDHANPDDSDGRILIADLAGKSLDAEETRRPSLLENQETSGSVDSENNRERISPSEETLAKSVPVEVRRNSFLETMLAGDSTGDSAMIAATVPSGGDEEINIPNEPRDKARKSETDIARESGRSRGLNNGRTEVDVKNRRVSRDSRETKKRLATVADVRSTRSENKSAGDARSDVLNELLCNFSGIKLKSTSPETGKTRARTRLDDDENIARPIDDGTVDAREGADFPPRTREKSREEARDVPTDDKTTSTRADNNATIVAREEVSAGTKIKGGSRDLKHDTRDPAIGRGITGYKNTETTKTPEASSSRGIKVAKDGDGEVAKTKIGEKPAVVKSSGTRAKASANGRSEGAQSAVGEVKPERKSRDAPKTILKKTNAECERRANEFPKRIPIGAPTTMNKIFDSRELEAITRESRGSSLEDGVRREKAERGAHGRGDDKKTDDEVIAADVADLVDRRIASRPVLALEDSGDKCAIARKTTSVIPCNNNDNNRAVTPVAVSNDQSSRDVVTITPGKVRSFVKYYEIRGDAATAEGHDRISDSEKVARRKSTGSLQATAPTVVARNSQRPVVATGRKERTRADEKLFESNDDDDDVHPVTSRSKARHLTFASRLSEDPRDSAAVRKTTTETGSKVTTEYRRNDVARVFDRETRAQHTKAGAKKSVQFLGEFTVIHSTTFDEDESAGIVADCDASSSRKRRAPGRPTSRDSHGRRGLVREITKSEKLPDADKGSYQRREAAAQIHAVAGHEENSGINRFVPKPETPQLVFYCTV